MVALSAVQGLPARRHCPTLCCSVQVRSQLPAQRARIFWDLDNINARSPEHALVIGHRIKRTVHRLTGVAPVLSAFANERTIGLLRRRGSSPESWDAVLDVLQAELEVAGLEKDAADLLMQRAMVTFAAEHGPAAAVVCVTNDQGFAPTLDKCGRLGSYTVAVGTYLRQAGFNWSVQPSKLPVPSAANCIVAFHPGRAALNSFAERRLLARWQRRLSSSSECGEGACEAAVVAAAPLQPLLPLSPASAAAAPAAGAGSAAGGVLLRGGRKWVPIRAHKGVMCTRWLNPARPGQLPAAAAPAGRSSDGAGTGAASSTA